jgi:hypothetical protein
VKKVKELFQNREATRKAIGAVMEFLTENMEKYKNLSFEEQFGLAMRFFQCERGRLQKGKMAIDVVTRLTPLILSILALMQAFR